MQGGVGEQAATPGLRALLADLLPDLRAYARFLAGTRAEADDLVQEALLRMLRAEASFLPGSNLRAWGITVLRHVFYEQIRKRRREEARIGRAPRPDTAHAPAQEAAGDLDDLARAIAALPPALREALVLVGAHGFSNEEAAAICDVPVGTIKARVSRARRQVAAALATVTA